MDVLSSAIEVMRTGRPSSSRLRVAAPWRFRFAPYDGAGFHVLLRGSGWLIPSADSGGADPVQVHAGDAVLLPHGSAHVLSSAPDASGAVPFELAEADPDGETEFLCGKYRLDRSRAHPLLAGLPEIVHLPAHPGEHPGLRAAIGLLATEIHEDRPGRDSAVPGLVDLLLVYIVRAWLDDHDGSGWPRALHDPQIAAILDAVHADPARQWRSEDLAAVAGVSRATLARRFTALTGQSPMEYVTWWRMTAAARVLRAGDLSLTRAAEKAGYSSPFAFSHAFKRHFGVSPREYRSGGRDSATG